jgi:hypothetical protein
MLTPAMPVHCRTTAALARAVRERLRAEETIAGAARAGYFLTLSLPFLRVFTDSPFTFPARRCTPSD